MERKVAARAWLTEMRKSVPLTQEELAKEVGISRTYLSEIESGIKNPGGFTAQKIAKRLGFDMGLFFADQCLDLRRSTNEQAASSA